MNADNSSSVIADRAVSTKQSVNERKFALLKRTGLFTGDLKGCTIERACTASDLKSAYRLVHDTFVKSGFLTPEPAGIRLRMHETMVETATFVAKHDGVIVGVLSIVGDSPALGLPSDSAFKTELNQLRADGLRLFEITNQAVAEEYRRSAVASELMACAVAHVIHCGYDRGIASVSPSHRGFYSMIGFEQVGAERSYSDKLHDPVIALSLNLDQYRLPVEGDDAVTHFIHNAFTDGNKFRGLIAGWCRAARKAFLTVDFLRDLFLTGRNFISECSAADRAFLRLSWGESLFVALTSNRAESREKSANRVSVAISDSLFVTSARVSTELNPRWATGRGNDTGAMTRRPPSSRVRRVKDSRSRRRLAVRWPSLLPTPNFESAGYNRCQTPRLELSVPSVRQGA